MPRDGHSAAIEGPPMKLLVTGGAGFIGSNFVRYQIANHPSVEVTTLDALTYAGNVANREGVFRLLERGVDVIVHFAAESHVDRSIEDSAVFLRTNVLGTQVLLEGARRFGVKRFLHISTDEVYGSLGPEGRFTEDSPLRPSSPYAASKAAADLLVLSYVRTYGIPALITRSSNNYGPHQFPEKFLPLLINNALIGKPLPIYGDGMQQRDWLHVDDNCAGILAALERGRIGEIYNLGGADTEENLRMAKRVLRAMSKPETLLSFVKDRPGHDRRYALDSTKAEEELGWQRTISLDEGL